MGVNKQCNGTTSPPRLDVNHNGTERVYINILFVDRCTSLHYTPQLEGVEDAVGSRSAVFIVVADMPLWYAVVHCPPLQWLSTPHHGLSKYLTGPWVRVSLRPGEVLHRTSFIILLINNLRICTSYRLECYR